MRKATERKVENFFTVQDDILGVLKALQERLNALERAHIALVKRFGALRGEVARVRDLLRRVGAG